MKLRIVNLPESSVTILVVANFPDKLDSLYVEKVFFSNRNLENIYSAPDSLIMKEKHILQVSNFSSTAVTLQVGQVLEKAKNPENWLDRHNKYLKEALQRTEAHAQLIRKLASIRTPNPKVGVLVPNCTATITSQAPEVLQLLTSYHSKDDPLTENPLEGGPKLYENNEDLITSNCLIEELDINLKLQQINNIS